jgi:hypothetical protein
LGGGYFDALNKERKNMKRYIAVVVAVFIAGSVQAQDFATDLTKLGTDLKSGPLTNVLGIAGGNWNESSHKVGGQGLIGYNLGKPDFPFQPFIVPFFGVANVGHWYGVDATATLNKEVYPFRVFQGGATNGVAHSFAVDLFGVAGVGTDIAGEQFGPIKIPGKPNGKGAAAITGYGAACRFGRIGDVSLGAYASRTTWTTVDGKIDFFGVWGNYRPKHLETFFGI